MFGRMLADSMLNYSMVNNLKPMRSFSSFLLGLILGCVVTWFAMSPRVREDVKVQAIEVREKAAEKAPEVKAALERAGEKVADATADARTTAAIKLKLAAEPDLSALQISVDTTAGMVTLAGRVKSAELAERAVRVAESVDGVREVKSTLQVNPQ
jgi:hyperosmotically inducible periplasmic protein